MIFKMGDIKITRRIRKDIGDLSNLKKSLKRHGLLNPLLVTTKGELIAGYRRYKAAKELGWKEIEVKIVDPKNDVEFLEMEMEENILRKDFTQSELLDGMRQKRYLIQPNIFQRIWNFIKRLFGVR